MTQKYGTLAINKRAKKGQLSLYTLPCLLYEEAMSVNLQVHLA